jgi:hypothetical protein
MRDLNEGQKIAYEIVADKRSSKFSAPLLAFGAWHTSQRPGTLDYRPHEEP